MGCNKKEGRGNKDLKKGGSAGWRNEYLKKEGVESPNELWIEAPEQGVKYVQS